MRQKEINMFGIFSGFGRHSRDKGVRTRRPRSFRAAIEVVEDRTLCSINSTLTAINWSDANHNPHNAVFGIGEDNSVYMNEDDAGWVDLGGDAKQVSAGLDNSNLPEVFYLGSDDNVYINHLNGAGWTDMGGATGHVWQISAATHNTVFAITGAHAVLVNPSGGWGWYYLGGYANQISAGIDLHGNPEVFAIGGDNALYVNDFNGKVWSGWSGLGGSVSQISATVQNTVYAIWGDGSVRVNSGSGFVNLGGWAQQICAGLDYNNCTQVLCIGSGNHVYVNDNRTGWQDTGSWFSEIATPAFEEYMSGYEAYAVGQDHMGYLYRGYRVWWSLGGYLKLPGDPGTISAISSSSGGMPHSAVLGIGTVDGVSMNEDAIGRVVPRGDAQQVGTGIDAAGNPEVFAIGGNRAMYVNDNGSGSVSPGGYVQEIAAPAFDLGRSGDVAYAVGHYHGGYRYRPGFVSLGGYRQG
jgi:hypothetical protein